MDIGIRGDEDYQALAKAMNAVKKLSILHDALPQDMTDLAVEGSDLAWALEKIPEPLVDPRHSIYSGLATMRGNLWQIVELFSTGRKATPAALQTLLRAALLAGARVAYPMLAADRDDLLRRSTIVMAQEGKSLRRLYRDASQNTELLALLPPPEVVEKQEERFAGLGLTGSDIISDSAILNEVATSIGARSSENDGDVGSVLKEQYSWIFNRRVCCMI